MKKIIPLFFAALLIISCGTPGEDVDDKIRDCVAQGGTPIFTTYKNGQLREFIICDKVP